MDKIKLYSPLKNIISNTILDNSFDRPIKYFNPRKYFKKDTFKSDNIIIDITSLGTNIILNPTIYMKGSNMEQISINEMKTFIERFETDMQIDSSLLTLTGFDFNENILTNHPPKNYLNLFRLLPRYDKTQYKDKTGLTFKNNCKSFIIYDKLREQEKKKIPVLPTHMHKNILRMELCVNEKMNQTKNLKEINTMKDLTTPKNYNNIITEWKDMYTKINKQQTNFKIRNLVKPHSMEPQDYLVLIGINNLTMEGYFNLIDTDINIGLITTKQGKARKEKALSVWHQFISYSDNSKYDLLEELNTKVERAAQQLIIT